MEYFRNIDQLRSNELQVIRHGFWQPWFELTDGQFMYGKLTQTGLWKPVITLETPQKTWKLRNKGAFKRSMVVEDLNGIEIGTVVPEIFSTKIKLSLNNGFEATFLKKKIFKNAFTLVSDKFGDILSIKTAIWSMTKPFDISINQDNMKMIPDIPLLALLGIKLIMIRQAQAHASAGVPV